LHIELARSITEQGGVSRVERILHKRNFSHSGVEKEAVIEEVPTRNSFTELLYNGVSEQLY